LPLLLDTIVLIDPLPGDPAAERVRGLRDTEPVLRICAVEELPSGPVGT
jgi:hypothetical protein